VDGKAQQRGEWMQWPCGYRGNRRRIAFEKAPTERWLPVALAGQCAYSEPKG
jgi:hypothetical protein